VANRFSAFLWGGLIGAAIGVLYAPRPGKETREELRRRADELMDEGMENYEEQKGRVLEAVETGRQSAVEKSEELKGRILETRDRLKAQVDAAAEQAKEKINTAVSQAEEPQP
jgi:gas vesicle protein